MNSKKLNKIIKMDKEYLFQNYGDRLPVCFVKGEDSILFDQDGNKYIDFFSGIAVNALGYNHPEFTTNLHYQIDKIIHTSNWYFNIEQIEAAKLISQCTFKGKTLFTNSGTEANEAAIKLARKYGISKSKNKYKIISFNNSFHGRTFGSMTATAQKKIHKGFGPIVPGFIYLPFNDIEKFKKEINKNKDKICAVITELIQGEGGIVIANKDFIEKIYQICMDNDILFIVDEVQTGIGRTGKIFAFQHYDIKPHIITMAKGLGSGIPIGAIHAQDFLANYLPAGSHGTTFGGNHLATKAASIVLKTIKSKSTLKHINKISKMFFNRLNIMKEKYPNIINEVRGIGLHIGIELKRDGNDLVKKALQKGLIINCTSGNVIRIMPPLIISANLVEEGLDILENLIAGER